MYKKIPEIQIFVCDVCLKENQKNDNESVLCFSKLSRDYTGSGYRNDITYEICDSCDDIISKKLDNIIEEIRDK